MLFFKTQCRYFSTLGIFILFLNGCSDTELHPEDVEYRVDENGTELLYQIGKDYPFGYGERSYIVDYFPNKKIKFKIEFFNGKRHGNFTFWQDNGLPVLKEDLSTASEMEHLKHSEKSENSFMKIIRMMN